MPISPITRLLWLLTALVFPLVFLTLEARNPWVANTLLGIALLLLLAAVFLTIRSGGAFDERAFHLTRPQGTGRVLRQYTLMGLGAAAGVALLAAARGYWFNLGWRAAWAAGLIGWVLMLLIIAAAATGFTLAMGRSRATARVAWVLIGIPVGLQLWLMEIWHRSPRSAALAVMAWTINLNLGVVIAAIGYGVAWWLAAGRRKWRGSLLVAAVAGASLSLPARYGPLLGRQPAPLPAAAIQIERVAVTDGELSTGLTASGAELRAADIFRVSGLQADEYLSLAGILPVGHEVQVPRVVDRFENHFGACFRADSIPTPARGWVSSEVVCGDLPGWPLDSVMPGSYHSWVRLDPATAKQVEQAEWPVRGAVCRIGRVGSLPLLEGGRLNLPGAGCVRMWPAQRGRDVHGVDSLELETQVIVPHYRVAQPARTSSEGSALRMAGLVRMAVVDGSGSRAIVLNDQGDQEHWGLASCWMRHRESIPIGSSMAGWSIAEIDGAKVYIFLTYPIGTVEQLLPPPRD